MTGARRIAWSAVLLAFGWITVSALWPREGPPRPQVGHADKLQHGLVWLGLTIVLWPAVRMTLVAADGGFAPRGRRTLVVWGAMVAYGALIEVLQSFVPGRSMEALDLAADAAGSALACALLVAWERWRTRPGRPCLPPDRA